MTTMTREEALTIVTSIVREHSRECREPKPCQDCELEAEAIAALSAQAAVGWQYRGVVDVGAGRQYGRWQDCDAESFAVYSARSGSYETRELYAAPPALHQLGAKVEVSDG
jgi:hypothetical protein